MKLDLRGKDYKLIEGFVILTEDNTVYASNGNKMGVLPRDGQYPQSAPELLSKLQKPEEKQEEKKVETKKTKKRGRPMKKGLSMSKLTGR